jgi:hypothetical protein
VTSRAWRTAAGVFVLIALLLVAIALWPPYFENFRFQRWLDDQAERRQAPEALQAAIVDKAAQLGLPVRAGDVHVTRTGNALRVDIVYVVRVDIPLYTVDLHFHPAASTE